MKAPNIEATIKRWSTPGTWLLLAVTVAFFGPGVWDRHIRTRPWITAEIAVVKGADGQTLVKSTTNAHYRVNGRRLLWIEDERGDTLCAAQRADSWGGRRERTWTFAAFLEHECTEPAQPYRLCSEFAVETDLGSHATFGPFCSQRVTPRG